MLYKPKEGRQVKKEAQRKKVEFSSLPGLSIFYYRFIICVYKGGVVVKKLCNPVIKKKSPAHSNLQVLK